MAAEIKVEGAQRLAALSARLKDADKTTRNAMRARLRTAVRPVLEDVKIKAAEHSKTIPRSVVAEFKYGEKTAGVSIKAKRSKMPKGKEALPGLLERGSKGSGGRYIRHPVFARTTHSRLTGRAKLRNQYDRKAAKWVNQPTHPFLVDTVHGQADNIRRELTKVLDDVERSLDGA